MTTQLEIKSAYISLLSQGIFVKPEFFNPSQNIANLCKRGTEIPSTPTRCFGLLIEEAIRRGKKLFRADIGMPYEEYSDFAKEALRTTIEETEIAGYGSHIDSDFARKILFFYQKMFGLSLEKVDPQKLLIAGLGASELFPLVLDAITNPGDLILTSDPHYSNFNQPMATHGVGWVTVKTSFENNFHPNLNLFKLALENNQIRNRIKAIYINSPHNPTGAVLAAEEIREIIGLAIQHNKFIIWDGVYWNYNYDEQRPSSILQVITQLSDDEKQQALDKLLLLDSMSKTFYLCDWRLGWAFIPNQAVFAQIVNASSYRGNISIQFQKAAALILQQTIDNDSQILRQNRQNYQEKRDLVWQRLKQMEEKGLIKLPAEPPEGGIYITFEITGTNKTTEEFLTWVLTDYPGQEICTFVPITTKTGSFYNVYNDGYNDGNREKQQIRFCFGILKIDIEKALNAFEAELTAFLQS